MTRSDLQLLATMRLGDANALLKARRYSAAYYLAGYAVECALKACIAKQTRKHTFPPDRRTVEKLYTHDLGGLAKEANLEIEIRSHSLTDTAFGDNWAITKDWSERARYQRRSHADARDLIEAIADPAHGVLAWLRQRW